MALSCAAEACKSSGKDYEVRKLPQGSDVGSVILH